MTNTEILVLDTETTGISKTDEILQLSIINGDGEVVMNEYFRPEHTRSWYYAEKVNHISPAMVEDKPAISERKREIENILHAAKVIVGYNLPFDQGMLIQNGIYIPSAKKVRYVDLMKPFARTYGEKSEKYPGQFKYQKLITCAKYYGYTEEGWHDSLADTKATLYCFWKMVEDGSIEV